jgi:hypothetical protein
MSANISALSGLFDFDLPHFIGDCRAHRVTLFLFVLIFVLIFIFIFILVFAFLFVGVFGRLLFDGWLFALILVLILILILVFVLIWLFVLILGELSWSDGGNTTFVGDADFVGVVVVGDGVEVAEEG